jgi:predicted O-linked N-acetylglucosamine transferase (SPINDLY family)
MKARPSATTPQALLNQALAFHQAGQLGQATALYRQLLQAQPRNADVLWLLGSLECQTGHLEQGAALLSRLVDIAPDHAYAHYNLGLALNKLGRLEEAISSYAKALAIKPDYAEAHINRGTALRDLNRWGEALANYDQALAVRPNYAEAFYNRGLALGQLERPGEALASYAQALAINPGYAEAHAQRGEILFAASRFEEALAGFEQALAITPTLDFLRGQALYARLYLCDWRLFDTECERLAEQLAQNETVSSPFPLLAVIDAPQVHRRAAELYAAVRYPAGHGVPEIAKRGRRERIRIGYFSADFRHHPMMHLMAEMLELHDRQRFELIAFSFGPDTGDSWRERAARAFDQFIDIRSLSDREAAALARNLELDLAIDLNGFTLGCRPGIFADRAAPIQVNYMGYPGTMGAPYIDYLLADRALIPADARQHYCEKIVYLPDTYQANCREREISDQALSRSDLGLPASGFVFCSFNTHYKITPDVFDSWLRIITRVPDSVLWLLVGNQTARLNLGKRAAQAGVDPRRLIFAASLPVAEHLNRLRSAHLFLDTFPYTAHTTASDALRMGLPIVTRSGQSFASRVAASLLKVVGVPDLITTTPQEYEALAVTLATQPEQLAAVRQRLLANLPTCALFGAERFTRAIESAYIAMYERYQDDLSPDHIVVT